MRITDRRGRKRKADRTKSTLILPRREERSSRYNTHRSAVAASAHWLGARRCAARRAAGFQHATPYKTMTGVTAWYQQVMPKKEEDTPSSGISSSVSHGSRRRRRRWFNIALSSLSLALHSTDRRLPPRIHLAGLAARINTRGLHPFSSGGMRARNVDEIRGGSFDRSMI